MIINFLLFLSLCLTQSYGQTCDEKGKIRIDSTYAKLMVLGGSGRKFPENKQGQLKKFCDQTNAYLKDAYEYKDKCLKHMPKQVTGVIVFSVRNKMNQLCRKDSKKLDELVDATPCINSGKREIDQCYTHLIDKFQGALNADTKIKIPHICCDYFKFLGCVSDQEKARKYKQCNEKRIEVGTNFIREIFSNVVDLICGDYTENSDKCDKIVQTPKKKKGQKRSKSFMLPLIEAISSLPEA